ncbi:DNA ligase [Brevundimonas phage vB_BpoS-Marchewka]|uniref:DNA ligase n=1 Tax=Brevundimonas phage vB_BpoS-Marchewka TaxID=2948604 RepID=A0A9E7SSM7_9CAUD|nr:DNA ligase [Brevundimonas phage vB_BpoS-Marchewka]
MTDFAFVYAKPRQHLLTEDGALERHRPIYKVDALGKMRVWFMERQDEKHRVVSGFDGGSLVANAWTVCKSKGKGKAQTTPLQQCAKEVEALYKKALERDYYETHAEAKGPPRNYLPMLAESWKDTTWDKWVARLKKAGSTPLPGTTGVYFQPKLDGYCCISYDSKMQSREGLPILTAPHVVAALESFYAMFPGRPLHGELYNHDLKEEFEALGSLLKKQKDITQDHIDEVVAKVQFHVYDYPGAGEHLPFGERIAALKRDLIAAGVDLDSGVIQIVETTEVQDEAHLETLCGLALEAGYEGGIGRLHLIYEKAKRSWSVIKIKIFDDAEFEVVMVLEGEGNYAGYAKAVVCWLPGADQEEGPTKDNTFKAGIKGQKNQRLKDLLTEENRIVTIRYFGYTYGGTGKPRFAVATKWHGLERVL